MQAFNWLNEAIHIRNNDLIYTQSNSVNVKPIQKKKNFHKNTQNYVWLNI